MLSPAKAAPPFVEAAEGRLLYMGLSMGTGSCIWAAWAGLPHFPNISRFPKQVDEGHPHGDPMGNKIGEGVCRCNGKPE